MESKRVDADIATVTDECPDANESHQIFFTLQIQKCEVLNILFTYVKVNITNIF